MAPNTPSIYDLSRLFMDESYCIGWLANTGVFYQSLNCEACSGTMAVNVERAVYQCTSHSCRKEKSLRVFTFFYGSKLPCSKILFLGYLWVCTTPWTSAFRMSGH